MARDEDWDELGGRPRKGRKPKKGRQRRTKAERLDDEHHRTEQNEFLRGLNDRHGRYEWMKEERYNTMFRDIEAKTARRERGRESHPEHDRHRCAASDAMCARAVASCTRAAYRSRQRLPRDHR